MAGFLAPLFLLGLSTAVTAPGITVREIDGNVTTQSVLSSSSAVGLGGVASSMPMPRIGVVGKQLTLSGQEFKPWGYQHLEFQYMENFFLVGGAQERAWVTNDITGNRAMGANSIRLHMDLWWFIAGIDKDNLEIVPGPVSSLLFFLETARDNEIYVLLSGNNTWHPEHIPGWFDELHYTDRWDVSAFYWSEIASAVVAAGHSATVLGYELANEPSMDTDPNWEWYGNDAFGVGIYYRHLIARGPEVNGDTVRAWITRLRNAIKSVDSHGLVTFGAFPYFNNEFGFANTEDLLDYLEPHCYPPLEPWGQTQAEQLYLLRGWLDATKPLVNGEISLWSTVPANNVEFMGELVANYNGVISFSYGYSPDDFTAPPDPPKFPANPDTPSGIYAAQRDALELLNSYRDAFIANTEPLPANSAIKRGVLGGSVSTRRTLSGSVT
jgi:hypothetical protein